MRARSRPSPPPGSAATDLCAGEWDSEPDEPTDALHDPAPMTATGTWELEMSAYEDGRPISQVRLALASDGVVATYDTWGEHSAPLIWTTYGDPDEWNRCILSKK